MTRSVVANRTLMFIHDVGQEVFYRMRSYGASIADTALLLVAADDGVRHSLRHTAVC